MGEIAINPIHNVHKKYREMNLVNPYVFVPPLAVENTFIGGVASTINTPSLLAAKLGISSTVISNFSIVGSNIKCNISGSYTIQNAAFSGDTSVTYYLDNDSLVTRLGANCFNGTTMINSIKFNGVTSTGINVIAASNVKEVILLNLLTTDDGSFQNAVNCKTYYIPKSNLGTTALNNSVFLNVSSGSIIYANPLLQTNNSGGADGDLTYAISNGANVRYVANYTSPSAVSNLSTGNFFSTSVQLNFTAPSSANTLDFYEVYVNDVNYVKITASGRYVKNLTPDIHTIFI